MKKSNSWRHINSKLVLLQEHEVLELLEQERAGEKRLSILERLHQRYNSLRVTRERLALLKEATGV